MKNKKATKLDRVKELYLADLPPRATAVYLYLYQKCYDKESCFPSIKTICSDMNMSRSTVKRAITDLEREGFVVKERRYRENGGNSSNLYHLGD